MSCFDALHLIAAFEWSNLALPTPVSVALVALIGYGAGMWMRPRQETVSGQPAIRMALAREEIVVG